MSRPLDNSEIQYFLQQACVGIRSRALREEITVELMSHLEEAIGEEEAAGASEQEAITIAICRMGDPGDLGERMRSIHKPRVDWMLLLALMGILGVGLLLASSIPLAGRRPDYAYLPKQLWMGVIGLGLALIIRRMDYQKLHKLSWFLYGGTVLFSVLPYLNLLSTTSNGNYFINTGINAMYYLRPTISIVPSSITPYLFLISLAGILSSPLWNGVRSKRRTLLVNSMVAICFLFVPCFFYIFASEPASGILYIISSMLILIIMRTSWKQVTLFFAALITFCSLTVIFLNQFTGTLWWFNLSSLSFNYHSRDALERGVLLNSSIKAIREGGLWGHGFGVKLDYLPGFYSEMAFAYLNYSMGWLLSLGVAVLLLLLLVRLFINSSMVVNRYGQLLATGLSSIFAVQVIWNLGMSVGLLPMMGLALPFLSYGPLQLVVQLVMVGVILSALKPRRPQAAVAHHSFSIQ
jgi:cell division protein FtsW (lipid II flippase)